MWRRWRPTMDSPASGEKTPNEDDLTVVLRSLVDRREFGPLYERYLTPVLQRCTRNLGNADDGHEATSVTFHNALIGLDSFRGDGAFESWLFRIADNACNDIFRRRQRWPHIPLDEEDERPVDGPDPEQQAIQAMDDDRLEQALRKLPPRRERIVRLHLVGLKGREIAVRLGVSHDVVRQQQRLAFLQLADLLGDDRDGTEGRND